MGIHLRIIDYVANPGGGVRFAVETMRAMVAQHPGLELELASSGEALTRYRALLANAGIKCRFLDHPPVQQEWCYHIPDTLTDDCDHIWLPWIHRHAPPQNAQDRITASFHDAILFQFHQLFAGMLPAGAMEEERQAMLQWLDSPATIAVSSNSTIATLRNLFDTAPERFDLIPVSSDYARPIQQHLHPDWHFAHHPFLLCPANICPHKNHETLFRAFAAWKKGDIHHFSPHSLVLTGQATHIHLCRWQRAIELKNLADQLGLTIGSSLHPLGYIEDAQYAALLQRAWALVMPTLAEGGGSFPVTEAIACGIPVLCSDIPPVREQVERMNAKVLWFDPQDPASLTSQLQTLEHNYDRYKQQALRQIHALRRWGWTDVATQYLRRLKRRLALAPPILAEP